MMTIEQDRLRELQTLLQQETETYTLLADRMQKKRDVLVCGKYHDLPVVDQELAALGQKTVALETRRMSLMESMGEQDKTLAQLIGHLDPMQAKPFLDARQKLLRVVEEVRDLNNHNQKLLNLSIQWVQDTVEVIAKAVAPETASYNAQGKSTTEKENPMFPLQSTVMREA